MTTMTTSWSFFQAFLNTAQEIWVTTFRQAYMYKELTLPPLEVSWRQLFLKTAASPDLELKLEQTSAIIMHVRG